MDPDSWTMDHVHFSQSRESVTEIRNATRGFKYPAFDACTVLLLNRPSTLVYSNTQPFSHFRGIFSGAEAVGERHFPFRLSAFSGPRSGTSLLLCWAFLTKCAITSSFNDICLIYFNKISSTQHPYL